jgi:DNA-binding phage protein
MHKIQFNLFDLIKRLEVQNRRIYTLVELAAGMGISRPTLNKLLYPTGTPGTSIATIASILDFFEAQQMPVSLHDLLRVENTKDDPHPTQPPA